MADYFLSCDWGTSSFRLKLIATPTLQVIAEENSGTGIAAVFGDWEKQEEKHQAKRQSFYLQVLAGYIAKLSKKTDVPLSGVPVVLSGMASSTIGIIDVPYTHLPFATDGSNINTHLIKADGAFANDVLIISGTRSNDDVMRGEETQLIGCMAEGLNGKDGHELYIFPGTHSKHIVVKDAAVVGFTTYMTGEFFALLSKQSILHTAVERHNHAEPSASFKNGVEDAAKGNILHLAFMVRTNDLFKKVTKEQNYDYLSGLLIGTEVKDLLHTEADVFLCCNSNIEQYYSAALAALGLDKKVKVFPPEKVDASVIAGQYKILQSKK